MTKYPYFTGTQQRNIRKWLDIVNLFYHNMQPMKGRGTERIVSYYIGMQHYNYTS